MLSQMVVVHLKRDRNICKTARKLFINIYSSIIILHVKKGKPNQRPINEWMGKEKILYLNNM